MDAPEGSRGGLAVVGRSGAEPEATFGPAFKNAPSTSYDRFSDEVDLSQVRVLALGDDVGLGRVLPGILELRRTTSFEILIEVGPNTVVSLPEVLAPSLQIGITGVSHESGTPVVHLGPAKDGVSGQGVRVLLEALQPTSPTHREDESDEDASNGQAPWWSIHLGSPRRRLAAIVGLALVVTGVIGLILIGRSDAGTPGVLVALGVATVLAQGSILAVTLLLLRRSSLTRVRDKRFQGKMLERALDAVDQGVAVRTQLGELEVESAHARKWRDDEVRRESTRGRRSQRHHLETQRQVQALLNLDKLIHIRAGVPPMGGWAASPDLLVLCVQALLERRPRTLVECGSGVSTLMLALAVEQHDLPTRIVALEHDAHFAEETRLVLARHGVADRAQVRLAPLKPVDLPGHETPWYDTSGLSDLEEIGILLVDGPPGATGPAARYPALPLLRDRLSARCLVVMDDLNRAADREVAERWDAEMVDFDLQVVGELQKKVGLLSRG